MLPLVWKTTYGDDCSAPRIPYSRHSVMGPLGNFSTASMTSFFTAVSMAAATVWREFLAQPVPATRM
jgi:hypothetical protein